MEDFKIGRGSGSFIAIKNSTDYYITFPFGGPGGRSPRYRVPNKSLASLRDAERRFEAWKRQQAEEAERGAKETRTVRFYLESHFKAVAGNLSETTRSLHTSTLKKHIYPDEVFMGIDIFSLKTKDFEDFLARREASDHTKRRIYNYLHWAFQAAVDERKLPENPIHLIKSKKPKYSKSDVEAFSPENMIKLIEYCKNNDAWWYPIVLLLFDSGIRMNEALALKWDKYDEKTGEIHIHRGMVTLKGGKVALKDTLKTDSSRRSIRLSNTTCEALAALRQAGTGHSGHLVSIDGEPVNRNRFHDRWERLLKQAGVPHLGVHSTRHGMAVRLLRAGHFITSVSRRMGHSKVSTTLDIYSDSIPSDDIVLAASFDDYVSVLQ